MKNKKIIIYILSFTIPLLIIFILSLIMRFLFFNSTLQLTESLMLSDMTGQYVSLYNYIRDVFIGENSIFYSFSQSLGGNMASTIGYYLSSPFNLLYTIVSKSNIPIMIWVTYMLKISLCSLFMCVFLSYKHGYKYMNVIFSLCYAFMGFTLVYHFNNMWLDVIYMTPLVIMGIEKLFEGKQNLYIITLCLSIIFNFYMAYMLCIFCVIYFVYKLLIKYKIKEFNKYKNILFRFIISSLIAGGLSAFFLLPVIINLKDFMRSPLDVSLLNINITEIFTSLFKGIIPKTYLGSHYYSEFLGRERPVIYVNLFCFVLSIFYFFSNKVQKREKILSFSVLMVFILSFIFPILKLVWQAFSFPNGYVDRFSFLYCFFIISLASKMFYTLEKPKLKTCVIFIFIYAIVSVCLSVLKINYLSDFNILLSVILIVILTSLYILFVRSKNNIYCIYMCVFIVLELLYNSWNTLSLIYVDSNYSEYYGQVCNQINGLEKDYYRVEGNYKYNLLNEFICNTNGIESSISTSNKNIYNFFYNNGGTVSYITIYYKLNKLPIFDSILGVKYIYSKEKFKDSFYTYKTSFEYKHNNITKIALKPDKIYIYENQYALSLGYVVDENILNLSYENTDNSLENLNKFFKSLSGISEDVLVPLEKEKIGDDAYKFIIDKKDKNLYLTYDYDISLYLDNHGKMYINGEYYDDISGDDLGIIKIENSYFNSEMLLEISDKDDIINDANLYYFNTDTFEKAINILKENQLQNVVVKGNKVSGNIEVDKDSVLFLSIPYEKGWNIYVDGEKVPYKKIADTFIGVNLSEGKHKIEMRFYSPGLLVGSIVSVLSLLSLILLNLLNKKRKAL